jgi:hypothetical protein
MRRTLGLRAMARGGRRIGLALAAGLAVAAGLPAVAEPLLLVTGDGTTGQVINGGQAAAVSFTLDQTYTNLAISADLVCVGCFGSITLIQGRIGPTATLANWVDGKTFNVLSSVDPLLQGLTLDAGDYFLVVAITTTGAGWSGSDPAAIVTAPGIVHGLDYFASALDVAAPFQSNFLPIASSASLHFGVTGDARVATSELPEPSAAVLSGLALMALFTSRRSRRGA